MEVSLIRDGVSIPVVAEKNDAVAAIDQLALKFRAGRQLISIIRSQLRIRAQMLYAIGIDKDVETSIGIAT